jgi:hypothetical protein
MTMLRYLETTPESCQIAAKLAPMGCMDEWLALDAGAAHELLALVQEVGRALNQNHYLSDEDSKALLLKLEPWITT